MSVSTRMRFKINKQTIKHNGYYFYTDFVLLRELIITNILFFSTRVRKVCVSEPPSRYEKSCVVTAHFLTFRIKSANCSVRENTKVKKMEISYRAYFLHKI